MEGGGGGVALRENHDTLSQEQQRGSERGIERAPKRQLSFCNGGGGGWLTTHCTVCLEHHGNRGREGLSERERERERGRGSRTSLVPATF